MKTLIEIHCYNRKNISELALSQIKKYKGNATLRIINDYSTEYNNKWLENYADEVVQYEKKLNINRLKYRSFKSFYDSDYDFFYMCDNDMYHDPCFMDMLFKLYYQSNKLPVTLYNSSFINSFGDRVSKIIDNTPNGHIKKGLFGGASTFLDKSHIKIINNDLLPNNEDIWNKMTSSTAWDSQWQRKISNSKYIIPSMSYVEHFGINGQNHKSKDSDYALNPTPFLKNISDDIWNKI